MPGVVYVMGRPMGVVVLGRSSGSSSTVLDFHTATRRGPTWIAEGGWTQLIYGPRFCARPPARWARGVPEGLGRPGEAAAGRYVGSTSPCANVASSNCSHSPLPSGRS